MKQIDEFQLSPRVVIRRGDKVKLAGSGGVELSYRMPGVWKVTDIYRRGTKRTYFEIVSQGFKGQPAGQYTVFVDGPPYNRHGLRWTPYKARRAN